jgi:hypothetical protein
MFHAAGAYNAWQGEAAAMATAVDGRERARAAVSAALASKQWSVSDLARRAGIDHGTAADFVSGERWPIHKTQGRIEEALGWEAGAIDRLMHDESGPEIPEMTTRHFTMETDDGAVRMVVTVRKDAADRVDVARLWRIINEM